MSSTVLISHLLHPVYVAVHYVSLSNLGGKRYLILHSHAEQPYYYSVRQYKQYAESFVLHVMAGHLC